MIKPVLVFAGGVGLVAFTAEIVFGEPGPHAPDLGGAPVHYYPMLVANSAAPATSFLSSTTWLGPEPQGATIQSPELGAYEG